MRSAFFYTLVVSVTSVFTQQPLARYSENLRKAVPPHYNHDQKNPHWRMDKIARGHKVEPRQPPLRPQPAVPWLRWVHEGRWAAQADKNTELHRVRARLLQERLKPNQFAFKPRVNPQLRPKLNRKENARIKREAGKPKVETVQKETEVKEDVRHKREATMPQLMPEMIMQPHMEAEMPQPSSPIEDRMKESEKRDKRQIVYFINGPPQQLARAPRTTPNPFIRDTHIEDYDIIRPEVGEREGMIPTVESGSSDPGSYPLVSETSDLEYESGYTISMSDSEEWHNYPLTTPSGPNPGWRLSTLADIYQKQRRSRVQILTPEKTSHNVKTIIRVWPAQDQTLTRAKRSPKQAKRRIGAYKEKLKQRRKLKDMRRKRRIIRNSKEDKAVKEYLKDDKAVERLLERPRGFQRQTAYQVEDTSREILWTNGTHNIVEDKDATVKWINDTHYVVYKDKDNSTEEWYHQHHILVYNEEWDNKTSEEKRNATIGVQDEEDDEEAKVKEAEKTKPGGKAVKKKGEKRKGKKGVGDKKAPKPKKKSKKSKKIMTVKNVNEEPKDPRKDPREWKTVKKSSVSGEETAKTKKKHKKVKTDDEIHTSASTEKKKKKVKKIKKDSEKDNDDSSKKKKRRKTKTENLDGKDSTTEIKVKKKKDKTVKDSQKEIDSDKKSTEKVKKKDKEKKEKKKRTVKSDKSNESDIKKRDKVKKTKTKNDSAKKDKDKTRKKRSIYRSSESETAEVRWEKVQKSEYESNDGWTVYGQDDKSQVYDASYELIETRNLTKKSY